MNFLLPRTNNKLASGIRRALEGGGGYRYLPYSKCSKNIEQNIQMSDCVWHNELQTHYISANFQDRQEPKQR
jgi:hypothetical protein